MTLLEKLGIQQPFYGVETDPSGLVRSNQAVLIVPDSYKRLQEQSGPMLEALIELCIDAEMLDQGSRFAGIEVIESATGKTWDEIKELL